MSKNALLSFLGTTEIYSFKENLNLSVLEPQIQDILKSTKNSSLRGSYKQESSWINPIKKSKLLYYSIDDKILLTSQKKIKYYDSVDFNYFYEYGISLFEKKENRKLSQIEEIAVREYIEYLYTRNFYYKFYQNDIVIDVRNKFIFIDISLYKQIHYCLKLLKETFKFKDIKLESSLSLGGNYFLSNEFEYIRKTKLDDVLDKNYLKNNDENLKDNFINKISVISKISK